MCLCSERRMVANGRDEMLKACLPAVGHEKVHGLVPTKCYEGALLLGSKRKHQVPNHVVHVAL